MCVRSVGRQLSYMVEIVGRGGEGGGGLDIKYCERRYFHAVRIFAISAFIKYLRKYVLRGNNLYSATYRQKYI